ncbi:MAG: efflux RND transporter periplasmic adaptor subunit, partial [Planctomycetota bacterium]|nr:efflux RND transporter periplasmic adaptor subunit [Planctomycetota bacterium]
MITPPMPSACLPLPSGPRGSAKFAVLAILVLGLLGAAIWYGFFRDAERDGTDLALSSPLVRGPLRVTVIESGNLESLRSHKVLNKLEGRSTIDYVIEEGTVLTPQDVRDGTVLVRLNPAELEEKRVRQEIEVSTARDQHAAAVTSLEIQLQQNASDLRKADLDLRFARLDLERYVGKSFAAQLLDVARSAVTAPESAAEGVEGAETPKARIAEGVRRLIHGLLESKELEGEGLQVIRELTSDIRLADEESRRAAEKLKHSERLEAKGYVSREDLEADRLALERREIEQLRARTAREQYVEYDFPKAVEKLLSDVIEAHDRRSRALKKADAAEAQKRSAVISKKKQLSLKQRRLDGYLEQEKSTTILATQPGLVVYASSNSGGWRRNEERIDEGATVRQGQALITIPDPSSLGVIIKVHETAIDKVSTGLDALIEVDAAPGKRFRGRVAEVARLPDSADRWLNPDLKVYTTKIKILGDPGILKPGMSAQVEILVKTLPDVLAAPSQAIAGTADRPAVYVWRDGEAERREVELGLASEHYVEIRSGLEAGMRLLLDPPRENRRTGGGQGNEPKGGASMPGKAPAATPKGPAPAGRAKPGGRMPKGAKRAAGGPDAG